MTDQAVVLAGGLATRLGDRARGVPKYLIEVAGRPFAHRQLEALCRAGLTEVLLCIGHLGETVREALGDGTALGVHLSYSDEGAARLGTGGALVHARALLAPTFVVTYGDSYLPGFDYGALLRDLEAHPTMLGTMAVYRNDGRYDRSNTVVEGDRVLAYDKAHPGARDIDYGATALRRQALERLPAGSSDLDALWAALAREGLLRAHRVTARFYEIGSAAGLDELEALLGGRA